MARHPGFRSLDVIVTKKIDAFSLLTRKNRLLRKTRELSNFEFPVDDIETGAANEPRNLSGNTKRKA